jgi:hypothetical protein
MTLEPYNCRAELIITLERSDAEFAPALVLRALDSLSWPFPDTAQQ